MPVSSYKAVLRAYNESSKEVQEYFDQLPHLVRTSTWEVVIAYLFVRLETAQNMALYCGVVKVHRASTTVAQNVINRHHLTRKGFQSLFNNVFGKELPKRLTDLSKKAELTRDQVVHGKKVKPASMRDAVVDILSYAEEMNSFVQDLAGFKPFNHMRGFKGRAKSLDTRTTKWLLKGLGFGGKTEDV